MDIDDNNLSGGTPTRVAIYELTTQGYERVAEFRWTSPGAVVLSLSEPDVCPLAQDWYANGIRIPGTASRITIDDAPSFMRALLQPIRLSYCRIVDESETAPQYFGQVAEPSNKTTPWSRAVDDPHRE